MTNSQWTRRHFIQIAGAASVQLINAIPLSGSSSPDSDLDSGVREIVPVNHAWRFRRQESPGSAVEAAFTGAENLAYDDSSWPLIWLPHTWDAGPDNPFATRGHFRGLGWYRAKLDIPHHWRDRFVTLNFKGVFQVADVWVNRIHAGRHVGGYTAFAIDVSNNLIIGEQNIVTVKVDDTLNADVAPSVETNVAVYGGIYRTVYLAALNSVHIPENAIWVTSEQKGKDVAINIHASLRNLSSSFGSVLLEHRILDSEGMVRAQTRCEAQLPAGAMLPITPAIVLLANPNLWSPRSPYLYLLQTTVTIGAKVIDQHSMRIGIRFMTHDAQQGFLLNGEPINLHGVNRRQDYGFLGDALPEAVSVRDVQLMKEMGVNFVRTAHYPQDPAVLNACDELGILVWEEIPNIKLYVYPPGIDLEGTDGVSSTRFSRPFMSNLKAQLKEMIEQNRNHPCIIIWGLGDDLSRYQYAEDFVELSDAAHAHDPTRWTAGRTPHVTDILDATVYEDLIAVHKSNPQGMYIWNEWGSFHSERGKEGQALIRGDHPPFLPDSEAALFCEGLMMQWNALPWLATLRWCMFDCGEPGGAPTLSLGEPGVGDEIKPRWPVNDYYGCMDMWRLPKTSFYLLQSQWTEKAMIHIVGNWTMPSEDGKPLRVRVYSNCDSVELFLNGLTLGSQKPELPEHVWNDFRAVARKYHGIEDLNDQFCKERLPGSSLRHPPFVWHNVLYRRGTLTAIGKKDGITVTDQRSTADHPAKLLLVSDKTNLRADGLDVAFVQAQVLDASDVLVPTARPWISLSVKGPARLLGTTEIDAISGIAAINLQSTGGNGRIVISAEAHGLTSASLQMSVM